MSATISDATNDWGAFEERGQARLARIVSLSERVARFDGNRKLPLTHVWAMGLPPADDGFLAAVSARAEQLSADALWRCADGKTLTLNELAAQWATTVGAADDGAMTVAVLQCVLANPIYFMRNRQKRITPRAADLVARALESQRLRAAANAAQDDIVAELQSGGAAPAAVLAKMEMLLYAPDKNDIVYQALKRFLRSDGNAFVAYFLKKGALGDMRDYWRRKFLEKWAAAPADADFAAAAADWAVADAAQTARVFSIDDAGTIEVDDAFSVARLADGRVRIGVHIAAPAATAGEEVARMARARMTSVYFPDEKFTMLPAAVIDACSLRLGELRPALSLYFYVSDGKWSAGETVAERVALTAQLTPAMVAAGEAERAVMRDFDTICACCNTAETLAGTDYFDFKVTANPPAVLRRERDETAVAVEYLMRRCNEVWGAKIAEARLGGFYRADGMTRIYPPRRHKPYAWLTSPLRRYIDLQNQRVLLAALGLAARPADDWRAAAADFERQYGWAKRCQQIMERHWGLLALARSGEAKVVGQAAGKGRVRLRDYPFYGVCASARFARDGAEEFALEDIDLVRQRVHLAAL